MPSYQEFETAFHKYCESSERTGLFRAADLMHEAGKKLFTDLRDGVLIIPDCPEWLKTEPIGRWCAINDVGVSVAQDGVFWETFWWASVVWIARAQPSANIDLPRERIGHLKYPPIWQDFTTDFWHDYVPQRLDSQQELALWKDIARTGASACHYLFGLLPAPSYVAYPARHFESKFDISGDTLRRARHEGRLRGHKVNGTIVHYSIEDVRRNWPDKFDKADADSSS